MNNLIIPHGEDLSLPEREQWFADECEAYTKLQPARGYPYHIANRTHGYRHLPRKLYQHVLAFGAGPGDELMPILEHIDAITLHEASQQMAEIQEIQGVPCTFTTAQSDGTLPFPDQTFDLITCLGVLHHIAKASTVLEEFFRVLTPGGYALIREPIVSMGNPQKPRKGLTPRERGLPLPWLQTQIREIGFKQIAQTPFQFLPLSLACDKAGIQPYNAKFLTTLDHTLCRIFPGSERYHRTRLHHHLAPTSIMLVLQRPLN